MERSPRVDARPTVYVVEKDTCDLAALGELLLASGLRPVLFSSELDFLLEHEPDRHGCLLLSEEMPILNGLELYALLAQSGCARPTILMASYGSIEATVQAIRTGVVNVLIKPTAGYLLLDAVREALALDAEARRERPAQLAILRRAQSLTAREREVLEAVALGLPNKRIAAELGIVEKTVKVHRAVGMHKLEIRSVPELIRLCASFGERIGSLQELYDVADSHGASFARWEWNIPEDRVSGNRQLASLFDVSFSASGGDPLDEFVGRIHPDDAARVAELITEAVRTGRPYEARYRIRLRHGAERSVIARGRTVFDSLGRPMTFPGIAFRR